MRSHLPLLSSMLIALTLVSAESSATPRRKLTPGQLDTLNNLTYPLPEKKIFYRWQKEHAGNRLIQEKAISPGLYKSFFSYAEDNQGDGIYVAGNPSTSSSYAGSNSHGNKGSLIEVHIEPGVPVLDLTQLEVASELKKMGIRDLKGIILPPRYLVKFNSRLDWWVAKLDRSVSFRTIDPSRFHSASELSRFYSETLQNTNAHEIIKKEFLPVVSRLLEEDMESVMSEDILPKWFPEGARSVQEKILNWLGKSDAPLHRLKALFFQNRNYFQALRRDDYLPWLGVDNPKTLAITISEMDYFQHEVPPEKRKMLFEFWKNKAFTSEDDNLLLPMLARDSTPAVFQSLITHVGKQDEFTRRTLLQLLPLRDAPELFPSWIETSNHDLKADILTEVGKIETNLLKPQKAKEWLRSIIHASSRLAPEELPPLLSLLATLSRDEKLPFELGKSLETLYMRGIDEYRTLPLLARTGYTSPNVLNHLRSQVKNKESLSAGQALQALANFAPRDPQLLDFILMGIERDFKGPDPVLILSHWIDSMEPDTIPYSRIKSFLGKALSQKQGAEKDAFLPELNEVLMRLSVKEAQAKTPTRSPRGIRKNKACNVFFGSQSLHK